jgi:hypothetical protein
MGATQMAPVHSDYQILLVRSYKESLSFCFLEVPPLPTILLNLWLCPLGDSYLVITPQSHQKQALKSRPLLGL